MNMSNVNHLIHPELFRIHLIKCTRGAGATTLLTTMQDAAERAFKSSLLTTPSDAREDFTVCVFKQNSENIHLQIWDDHENARKNSHYSEADVELFIADLSNTDSLNSVFQTLQSNTTPNSTKTMRILIGNKADLLDDKDDMKESAAIMEKLGAQFNIQQYAFTNANSTRDVKDLLADIIQSAIHMRNLFKNERKLREKLIGEIDDKIASLSNTGWFLTNRELNNAKKIGLVQLKDALIKETDTPIPDIITRIRAQHPKLNDGRTTQNTKNKLDHFIAESNAIPTTQLDETTENSQSSSAAIKMTRG